MNTLAYIAALVIVWVSTALAQAPPPPPSFGTGLVQGMTVNAHGPASPIPPPQSTYPNPLSSFSPDNPLGYYSNPLSPASVQNPLGSYGNPLTSVSPLNPLSSGPSVYGSP